MSVISGGRIYYSNSKIYLEGVEEGVQYANDSVINAQGIRPSDNKQYKYMLPIEDTDEDDVTVYTS